MSSRKKSEYEMSELTKPTTRKWVEQSEFSRDCTCSRFTR